MTFRKNNSMDHTILKDSEAFSSILHRVIIEIQNETIKVRKLNKQDEFTLNQFIKNQKDCRFHEGSSYFLASSISEVENKLKLQLKKNYLEEVIDIDFTDIYEGFLEVDAPKWLKDICSPSFKSEQTPLFVEDSNLWVTRTALKLLGPEERHWI